MEVDIPCCTALPCPPPGNNGKRDWAALTDGPAGLIAQCVLTYDIADYVRFRAMCRPWGHCCTEPRSHDGLDRRFHPRRWMMLKEELAAPNHRCFLNMSTGKCIQVDIPKLHDHELLALTPEGLLVLAHKPPCATTLCLLNLLTRHLLHLPPVGKLLPSECQDMLPESDDLFLDSDFRACASGIANDDSTVVLCLSRFNMIGMTKPGNDHWTLLDCEAIGITAPIMFEGRLYCVADLKCVMVLETGPPRLEVAAKLNTRVSRMAHSLHLVNNCGELMLVHRRFGCRTTENESVRCYDTYRVDLDTGTLFLVKSMGGRAAFICMHCSLAVFLDVFPSGSISADTIYDLEWTDKLRAYQLVDGSSEDPSRYEVSSVSMARPHTLADCLSMSVSP